MNLNGTSYYSIGQFIKFQSLCSFVIFVFFVVRELMTKVGLKITDDRIILYLRLFFMKLGCLLKPIGRLQNHFFIKMISHDLQPDRQTFR